MEPQVIEHGEVIDDDPGPAMDAPKGRSRWLGFVGALCGALLLLAAVVWTVGHERYRAGITPQDGALSAAAAIVDAELEPGDGMAFAPSWSATQRWRMARIYSDHAIDFATSASLAWPIEPWDLHNFQRLWILASHGRGDQLDVTRLGTLLRNEELGDGVSLLLVDLPDSGTIFDFLDLLEAATMERIGGDGAVERCRARGGKQNCRGEWWRDVYADWNEVGGTRHRCMFIQPHPGGGLTRLSWADVPVGDVVAGRFGNRLWAVRHEEGSEVELRVVVGNRVRMELRLQPSDYRYHAFRIDLAPAERGLPVAFEIRAEDHTWRQTCLDARLLKAGAPAL